MTATATPMAGAVADQVGPAAARYGREVLGPVVGEFCLRLWQTTALLDRPDRTALLFCARGGLRMQLAYETFCTATGLPPTTPAASLMVSRVAAIRPALAAAVSGDGHRWPATSSSLAYEFRRLTVAATIEAVTGVRVPEPDPPPGDSSGVTLNALVGRLRQADAAPARQALIRQAGLFVRHVETQAAGRSGLLLVDTGLYGTTSAVLAEGLPGRTVRCALLARSFRAGLDDGVGRAAFGLSVEAAGYSPLVRRTALLRYWHYIEWLFEPDLPSVCLFHDDAGSVRSDLEIPGWAERVPGPPDSAFGGVLDYLRGLSGRPPGVVAIEADVAWNRLSRSLIRPSAVDAGALRVGTRSKGFGLTATWDERRPGRAWSALRGSSMWREGEIARSGSALRIPLLAIVQSAHILRWAGRVARDPRRLGLGPAAVRRGRDEQPGGATARPATTNPEVGSACG